MKKTPFSVLIIQQFHLDILHAVQQPLKFQWQKQSQHYEWNEFNNTVKHYKILIVKRIVRIEIKSEWNEENSKAERDLN